MPWKVSEVGRNSDLALRQKKGFFVVVKQADWEDILTPFLRNQVAENASAALQRRTSFPFCDFILKFHQIHARRGVKPRVLARLPRR